MSLQEISVTNNQKKHIQKAIKGETIIIKDENDDLVINVAAYLAHKDETGSEPLEEILGENVLDLGAEFIVIS